MEHTTRFKLITHESSLEEIEEHVQGLRLIGNDLDVLNRSMTYFMAGRYDESIMLSSRVMSSTEGEEPMPENSEAAARTAFLDAAVRAKPLYEQAAREIEGVAEGSQTMKAYYDILEKLTHDEKW